jgi:aminopeptidase N
LSANFREVELDAVDILFNSVQIEGQNESLGYKATGGKVIVALDKPYGPQDLISLRFRYLATPQKGVYFINAPARSEGSSRSAQIWTQGEPDEARHWFPSFDFPSDKATTEQIITVEKGLTVIGNGELLNKKDNADGTETWHYKMPVPHTTYLVSFVVGKYLEIKDSYKNVPLGFYVYEGRENTARNAFGDTKKMFPVFEELTGVPYPFNKYDQTMVAEFQFGGMENITATTMADSEIFFADTEFGKGAVMDLVSHELAHSWFGNLVTCRNWAELWLNEGFATFMEAVYREKVNGRGDYLRKVRADAASFLVDDTFNRRRHALFNQRAGDVNSLFDNAATTYQKGGAVLHTLREQVGDANFWKAVNIYLNRHKFGSVETTDLQKAMEEASGQNLGWFFDQWVYGAGSPKVTVRPTYNAKAGTLTLSLSQTQLNDTITPNVFRLPLDISIKTKDGAQNERIEMTQRTQTFKLKVGTKPTEIDIDPGERIPLKKVTMRRIATVR